MVRNEEHICSTRIMGSAHERSPTIASERADMSSSRQVITHCWSSIREIILDPREVNCTVIWHFLFQRDITKTWRSPIFFRTGQKVSISQRWSLITPGSYTAGLWYARSGQLVSQNATLIAYGPGPCSKSWWLGSRACCEVCHHVCLVCDSEAEIPQTLYRPSSICYQRIPV